MFELVRRAHSLWIQCESMGKCLHLCVQPHIWEKRETDIVATKSFQSIWAHWKGRQHYLSTLRKTICMDTGVSVNKILIKRSCLYGHYFGVALWLHGKMWLSPVGMQQCAKQTPIGTHTLLDEELHVPRYSVHLIPSPTSSHSLFSKLTIALTGYEGDGTRGWISLLS